MKGISIALVCAAALISGCATNAQCGTVLGGVAGGAVGYSIAGTPGAVVGAGVGAVAGNAVGQSMDQQKATVVVPYPYCNSPGYPCTPRSVTILPPVTFYEYPCDRFPTFRARQDCKRGYEEELRREAWRAGREYGRRSGY